MNSITKFDEIQLKNEVIVIDFAMKFMLYIHKLFLHSARSNVYKRTDGLGVLSFGLFSFFPVEIKCEIYVYMVIL
jgi:hypothetical protein